MTPRSNVSPPRVAVIDDDRDVLELFEELLTELGYAVKAYADAWPGIEQLIGAKPDLIIVDLRLAHEREQLTGGQVIHAARSSAELRDVPIIVCSAATDLLHDAWPELMKRGDIQQLEKPFDLLTFERVVETALGLRHGSLGSRRAGDDLAAGGSDEQVGD